MKRVLAMTAGLAVLFVAGSMLIPWLRVDTPQLLHRLRSDPEDCRHLHGAPRLRLRPEDKILYPRASFGFNFETSEGERVDTFRGLAICYHDTTMHRLRCLAETRCRGRS